MATMLIAAGCQAALGFDEDFQQVVPDGWEGPFRLVESGGEPNPCPEDATEDGMVYDELDTDPLPDSCSCGPPADACGIRFMKHGPSSSSCLAISPATVLQASQCVSVSLDNQKYIGRPIDETIGGPCVAEPLPDPEWRRNIRVCRDHGGRCIRALGEQPCPEGPFSQRRILFGSTSDTRKCDCGAVAACSGTLLLFTDLAQGPALQLCEENSIPLIQASIGECHGPITASYVKYNHGGADCSMSGPETLTGEVVADSPFTFCCAPDA